MGVWPAPVAGSYDGIRIVDEFDKSAHSFSGSCMVPDATQLLRDARTLGMQAFGDAAFAWLRQRIAFDGGTLLTSTLKEPSVFDAHFYKLSATMLQDWEKVKHLSMVGHKILAQPCEPFRWGASIYANDESRAPLKQFLERYGLMQMWAIAIPQPGSALTSVVAVLRNDIENPFSDPESQVLREAVPVVVEAWAVNRLLCAGSSLIPHGEPKDAVALVGSDGLVRYATASWIQIVFGDVEQRHSPLVPSVLREAPLGKEVEWQDGAWYVQREAVDGGQLIRLRSPQAADDLGAREREVARLYTEGKSHKEIARALNISPKTVRNHLQNIFRKLRVSNRVGLAQCMRDRH